jgi:heat shock protein HslJ
LGCNLFFGNYSLGKKRIKLDYLGATKRLCADMQMEEQFSNALKDDIKYYYIEKNILYIRNKNNVVCKFEGITKPQ